MWIRLNIDWQHDPFVTRLDGVARHVLNTVWCLAARHGTATTDEAGEPEHATVEIQYMEPSFVARESGFTPAEVRKAMAELRTPVSDSEWGIELPAPIVLDVTSGVATIRNVGKFQKKLLKDRARKVAAKPGNSAEVPRKVAAVPRKVAVTVRNETNGTNNSSSSASPPTRKQPSPEAVAIAGYLAESIHEHTPTAKVDPDGWSKHVDAALRLDGRTPDQLRRVIDYAHRNRADLFWRANLLSGKKLRERFDQIWIKAQGSRAGPGAHDEIPLIRRRPDTEPTEPHERT